MKKLSLLSVSAVGLAAFALLCVACGAINQGIQAGKDAVTLQQLGVLYKSYASSKGKPPANEDDLMSFATAQADKDAVQAVKDKKFTLVWNAPVNDASKLANPAATSVLGYSNAVVGNQQRVVLTADGNVQTVADSAFQSMPKAAAKTDGKAGEKGKDGK